jgi:hypothetical protein
MRLVELDCLMLCILTSQRRLFVQLFDRLMAPLEPMVALQNENRINLCCDFFHTFSRAEMYRIAIIIHKL